MAALSTNKLLAADVGRLISSSSAAACEPIRSVTQERWGAKPAPMRNTCEFHIGRGRDGKPCCGFRLGLASSLDGTTVAPPTDVPFVPGWMAAVAAIVGEEMAIWAAAAQEEEEVLVVQAEAAAPHNNNDDGRDHDNYYYRQLRLRGSERRSKGVAVLTRGSDRDGDAHGGHSIDRLMERMKAAASEAGMRDLTIVERDTDGTLRPPTAGAIEEQLQSGLTLSISPLAFFQASTDAAEVLFQTVVEMATDHGVTYPSLLLDLCCGGGVLGLEVARAAERAAAPSSTHVVGIERDADAVDDANQNAAANGLHPPRYMALAGTVEDLVQRCIAERVEESSRRAAAADDHGRSAGPIVAVLDPPRTGVAPGVCKALRAAKEISKVIFVSCNPHGHTLRRDYVVKGGSLGNNLRVLCGERGRGAPFKVARIVPVDLFPHTPHVELVVLAVR